MLGRVRARWTVVLVSGAVAAGLALAGAALGAHSMTFSDDLDCAADPNGVITFRAR
jgi:hypothetical protein